MRAISKTRQPRALAEYLGAQIPTGVGLDYPSFRRKAELRSELIAEQFGLCAFTGAAIDHRMGRTDADGCVISPTGIKLRLKAHNAHIKPQSVCKRELEARGEEYGRVAGEDMDHNNIVAALLVEGAPEEMFGASAQGDRSLPVRPVDLDCEERFRFNGDGSVDGVDDPASQTIAVLALNHRTLKGWRQAAIETFIDPEIINNIDDLNRLIAAMDRPVEGELPEYCFAIKQAAMRLLP